MGEVTYPDEGDLFTELLVAALTREAHRILERGLVRSYERRHEELREAPRGRIDFARIARNGGIRRASLPCVHHSRSSDNLLNGVLHAGLVLSSKLARVPEIRRKAAQAAALLGEHTATRPLDATVLANALRSLNRLNAHYEPALDLVAALHAGTLADLDGAGSARRSLPGFLFDMNAWAAPARAFPCESTSTTAPSRVSTP
ncbi:MAG: hypothetical protein R3B99_23920 [Polyangiales bacterium]